MFAAMSKDQMIESLDRAGVPFAPVNRPADLVDDPHMNANGAMVEVTPVGSDSVGKKIKIPAIPVEMDQQKFGLLKDLPAPGSDSRAVLRELGYGEEEIQALLDDDFMRQK